MKEISYKQLCADFPDEVRVKKIKILFSLWWYFVTATRGRSRTFQKGGGAQTYFKKKSSSGWAFTQGQVPYLCKDKDGHTPVSAKIGGCQVHPP